MRSYLGALAAVLVVGVCLSAHAFSGSGESVSGTLETISPTIQSVSALTDASLSATFSEPMLDPGMTTPANYAVSGLGAGTLSQHPDGISGTGPYTLTWSAGEMQNGASVTVTATGLQDVVGNPIEPAHCSASGTGIGIVPIFTNLVANPAQASEGETVAITFTCSEPLSGDPSVTVNGHEATWVSSAKSADFTYRYVVQSSDPLGTAGVSVTGFDLAGNMGSMSSDAALEIVVETPGLPLYAWPAGLALLAVGIVLLAKQRRLGPALLVLALLVSASAFAQAPTVSNVTFSQSPNGGTTQVDIYYDLVAPNGPCAITVSLSKDGGADGYIYPVTSVTGDIANVTTGAGKHIAWDIRADYPEEAIPQAQLRVTADDGIVLHTLTYAAGAHGSVTGALLQTVNDGADGTPVTAVGDQYFHFAAWSDGRTDNPRTDTNVVADVTVTATFALNMYTVTYLAGPGGSISGQTTQTLVVGSSTSYVTAVPDQGYHFVGWSDGYPGSSRMDFALSDITVTAQFAINTYTITCNVAGSGTCTANPATVNYGSTSDIVVTPETNWQIISIVDSVEGAKTGSYTTTAVTANRTVTVTFSNMYDITCNVVGNGTCTANPASVEWGLTSDITVAPATDWHLVSVEDSEEGAKPGSYTTTAVTANRTVTATFAANVPEVTSFAIDTGAATSDALTATLDNTATNNPTEYMASESASFAGATWQPYGTASAFDLSFGVGTRTVYFKVRNSAAESSAVSDTIFLLPPLLPIVEGTFRMGNCGRGDDTAFGDFDEVPVHDVTLDSYGFGEFEVTTKEYCDVLNWAKAQDYLKNSGGGAWGGSGDIYAGDGVLNRIVVFSSIDCNVQYTGGVFSSKSVTGLPGSTNYSMDRFPMVQLTWYGTLAYCNWLSQWQGLTPCYDMSTANWPLVVAPPTVGGYRLPTEAEWERAAAWDPDASGGPKHWIYGFKSDTNSGPGSNNRCNDRCNTGTSTFEVNPLGLTSLFNHMAPIGWFNGTNISPNGNVQTLDSPSPVGAYDMSGNVWEMCQDWYGNYGAAAQTNPTGPATGSARIRRGGYFNQPYSGCRSAYRLFSSPVSSSNAVGFRVVRSIPLPSVTSFSLNEGADTAPDGVAVTLNNTASNVPTEYMASESASFTGAVWQPYDAAPSFTLEFGLGPRTVYFKVRNASYESAAVSDTIFVVPSMLTVKAGTFSMGRTSAGDDVTYAGTDELPVHSVTLGEYQVGKFEITNKEYCDVLNWALALGYLYSNASGTPYAGGNSVYAGNAGIYNQIVTLSSDTDIQFSGGAFVPKTRVGLPGTTNYSLAANPMEQVTWYGAVAFCNWLSQWQGLTPCYNMGALDWPLVVAPPTPGGYRLTTEAEWERAAAWDEDAPGGSKHWIYGFTSDTPGAKERCNDSWYNGFMYEPVNPLGLMMPYTSPAGWFNGINVSPMGNVQTVDGPSPVGAYDMSGNVAEWCQDWYSGTYYTGGSMDNPTGPATGTNRVHRGGGWQTQSGYCRTAFRRSNMPFASGTDLGFRVAVSTFGLNTFAIDNGAATAMSGAEVALNNTCFGAAALYMASESASFTGASWQPYETAPLFALSYGLGPRTVYFKVQNAEGQVSNVASDTIFVVPNTVAIATDVFRMGSSGFGDDASYGSYGEVPQHYVTLGAYSLGKYPVTNKEYCDVLNWALAQGYLKTSGGAAWAGSGDIYAGGNLQLILSLTSALCNIEYVGGAFSPKTRVGLPGATDYATDTHPVITLTWYGAAAFCDWLSLWQGLTPCYNMSAAGWPLTVAPPTAGGYRLPTEAEWEYAAAWDESNIDNPIHRVYGFLSDTNSGPGSNNRCNDIWYNGTVSAILNPLGLTGTPYTSPVGWFNGTNVSPNGSVATLNSPSPVGAYDMSGNVWQWVNDWYSAYTAADQTNPTGPSTGTNRLYRGGSWNSDYYECRTACRMIAAPTVQDGTIGFRLARSN